MESVKKLVIQKSNLWAFFLVTLCLSIVDCSTKDQSKLGDSFEKNGLHFVSSTDSIPVFKGLDAGDEFVLAEIGETKLTAREIYGRSPAISDYLNQYNMTLAALLYREGEKLIKKTGADKTISIEVYFSPSEMSLKPYLDRLGIEESDNINLQFVDAPAGDLKGVGKLDGEWVEEAFLKRQHLSLVGLERAAYDEVLRLISNSARRHFLYEESKKNNQNVETFVEEKILTEGISLSDEDFQRQLAAKSIAMSDLTPQLEKKLRNIFKDEKRQKLVSQYISDKLLKAPIKLHIDFPKLEIDFNEEWAVLSGSPDAALTVAVFSNFTCLGCKRLSQFFREKLKNGGQNFKIAYRFHVAEKDIMNELMAEAAMCANHQGNAEFWRYHDYFVRFDGVLSEQVIKEAAEIVGLNNAEFRKCYLPRQFRDAIDYHTNYAKYLGVRAEPTVIVGNEVFEGVINETDLDEAIKRQSVKAVDESKGLWNRIKTFFGGIFS